MNGPTITYAEIDGVTVCIPEPVLSGELFAGVGGLGMTGFVTDGVCLCHKTKDELRSMAADRGEVRLTLEERVRILKTFIEEGGNR